MEFARIIQDSTREKCRNVAAEQQNFQKIGYYDFFGFLTLKGAGYFYSVKVQGGGQKTTRTRKC